MSTDEDVHYLAQNDIPLILDDLVAQLIKFKPLTPRKCLAAQLQSMVLDGRCKRPERRLIYFVGGPASGKGTLARMLCEHFGEAITTVGAGDLLRDEVKKGTEQGKMIESIIVQGNIVPAHITIGLLKQTIEALPPTVKWVLIDGFPRAMEQGWTFEKTMGVGLPEFMLCFHCPDELMFSRMVKRGATSGRADDNETTARKRIATHHAQSVPSIEYYRSQGILYDVDASAEASITWPMVLPLFIDPADLPDVVYVVGGSAQSRAQCQQAAESTGHGYLHFPDLLEKEAKRNANAPSRMVADALQAGLPVPMSIQLNLLRRALHQLPKPKKYALVYGFPKTIGDVLDTEKRFKDPAFLVLLAEDAPAYTHQEQAIITYFRTRGMLKEVAASKGPAAIVQEVTSLLQ
jgi:adenylate kinase family enzyme